MAETSHHVVIFVRNLMVILGVIVLEKLLCRARQRRGKSIAVLQIDRRDTRLCERKMVRAKIKPLLRRSSGLTVIERLAATSLISLKSVDLFGSQR